MVIAAGRDEQDVAGRPPAGHVARLGHDVEAEHADVEVAHAVDVRGAQVDVADPHAGSIGSLGSLDRCDVALRHAPDANAKRARRGIGRRCACLECWKFPRSPGIVVVAMAKPDYDLTRPVPIDAPFDLAAIC